MIIYTDGSCRKNGAEGGFGVVVIENNEVIETYSKQTINTTNNRMEISAILWALENYGDKQPTIFSDSSYCVNMFTTWIFDWYKNDWIKSDGQIAKNIDLLEKFMELYNQNKRAKYLYCKGHSGIKYNELADDLATNKIA